MRRRHRRALPTDLVVTAALLAGLAVPALGSARAGAATAPTPCPGSGPVGRPPVAARDSPGGATTVVETLVDRRRGTEATAASRARDCRVLPVDVHVPAPSSTPAPHPLLVVVHGRDGAPASLRPLLDTWVAAGYVVAAPTFPVTRKDSDDKPLGEDVAEQARDVSFVISRLLAQSDDPTSPLAGVVDPGRIGAVGMSLGGMTVYGLVADTCCRDRRVDAAIVLAGVHRDFPHGRWVPQRAAIMLLHGDADQGYHNSVDAYPELAAPKWFITLRGAFHSPPFEIPRGSEAPLVDAATTLFWNRYLLGERSAAREIVAAVHAARDRASLARDLGRGT
jgi:dienelactone hydrolase